MICPKCDAEIDEGAAFCSACGVQLIDGAPAADPTADDAAPRERFLATVAEKQAGPEDDDEDDLWQGSYAKLAMLGSWISGAVATVVAPVIAVVAQLPNGYWTWLLLGILFMWAVLIGVFLYRRFSVHYLLTSQRLIHESGLLWRQTDRVELIDIDDVTFRQDPVQRLIGVGTIIVSSSDRTDPELRLLGIADARQVADTIDDARRRERRRRGLHIESV